MLATNYNAEDPPFDSTVQMLATQYSNYCRPADSITHAIECAPTEVAMNVLYVRTAIDGKQKDLRLTDLGFTTVATEGMQSTSEVGGLWISYDVTLMKPILQSEDAVSDGFDQFRVNSSEWGKINGVVTARNNRLGGSLSYSSPNAMMYQWPESISSGQFLLIVNVLGATTSSTQINTADPYDLFNCKVIVDDDKDGPTLNGGVINPSNYVNPQIGRESIFLAFLEVTGPRPRFAIDLTVTVAACNISFDIFPISYTTTPEIAT
jgi:hypothetical protein